MTQRVEVVWSFRSPYSYLAASRLLLTLTEAGAAPQNVIDHIIIARLLFWGFVLRLLWLCCGAKCGDRKAMSA